VCVCEEEIERERESALRGNVRKGVSMSIKVQ
jgi:hypothetical protein